MLGWSWSSTDTLAFSPSCTAAQLRPWNAVHTTRGRQFTTALTVLCAVSSDAACKMKINYWPKSIGANDPLLLWVRHLCFHMSIHESYRSTPWRNKTCHWLCNCVSCTL